MIEKTNHWLTLQKIHTIDEKSNWTTMALEPTIFRCKLRPLSIAHAAVSKDWDNNILKI